MFQINRLTSSRVPDPGHLSSLALAQQLSPGACQGLLNPQHRGQQDIDAPRLDLLDGPNIQVHGLGELLLGQFSPVALTPQIGAKALELGRLNPVQRHAVLGRIWRLTNTAQWGVIGLTKGMRWRQAESALKSAVRARLGVRR